MEKLKMDRAREARLAPQGQADGRRRPWPSHGENRGSIPLGSANEIKMLLIRNPQIQVSCPTLAR